MQSREEKLRVVTKGRFVVFIDAANLEQSVKKMHVVPQDIPDNLRGNEAGALRWSVDYRALSAFLRSLGDCREILFYTAEFVGAPHQKFRAFLSDGLNFLTRTKPLKEYADHTREAPHRKANFDVEIAVDAVHMLDGYDTAIIFSGDSDFEYLVKFLRGRGKVVLGFSRTGHVAKELPPALTHYFDIVDFRARILRVREKAKSPAS